MKITPVLIAFMVLLFGCSEELPLFDCACETQHVATNDRLIHVQLKDKKAYNDYIQRWKIPPIQNLQGESYRLKSTHSFSKFSHIYTLTKNSSGAQINVRQYSKKLSLDKQYTIRLSDSDWKKIKTEIEESCFWSNPINNDNWIMMDGGSWTIEAYDPDARNCGSATYHYDWCYYDSDGEVGDLARLIKSFSKEEHLVLFKEGL
jgi:hypothetical protein